MKNILWTSRDAAKATGGHNKCDWVAYGVSIDTRTLKKGDIFIAVIGDRNGHDFVAEAFRKGASAALVSYVPKNVSVNKPLLVVEDVRLGLEALASFARKRFKGQVIAITGSVGKTSSKDMLADVLSKFGKVSKAEKSFNNHLGVPLTLARTPPNNDFLIVEIGMSNKNEIAPLSALVQPHIALITDVSEAHLASFNDVGEIAKEKSDICFGLTKQGHCVVCRDSREYVNLSKYINNFQVKIISFGENKSSMYKLKKTVIMNNKTCAEAVLQNGVEFFFKVNSPGAHHARNALGIICILEILEIDIAQGMFELSNWNPSSGRGLATNIKYNDRHEVRSFTIIDETYNANPTSVIAALKMLSNFSLRKKDENSDYQFRRIAILGDMLELGTNENKKHSELVEKLNFDGIDVIYCIGTCMNFFYKKLPASKRGKWCENVKDFSSNITDIIKDQDIIMIKGSNSVGLNSLVKQLKAMGTPG